MSITTVKSLLSFAQTVVKILVFIVVHIVATVVPTAFVVGVI